MINKLLAFSQFKKMILSIVILLLLLTACTKEDQLSKPSPSSLKPLASPLVSASLPPPRAADPSKPEVIKLSPIESKAPPDPSLKGGLTNEGELFTSLPQQRLVAEDFRLGPLEDCIKTTLDFAKAYQTISLFFKSLLARNPDYSLCEEKSQKQLRALLNYPLSQGLLPDRFRLGKFSYEGQNILRANIRLYKGKAITEGEIYLTKAEDVWLLSDLQVGFVLLNQEYQPSGQPFRPGGFEFLLRD